MGTTDRDSSCGTCGCSYIECPGHFGHITLAQPVYHPGYVTHVRKVLRCICCECGLLRLRDDGLRKAIQERSSARTRFRRVFEACKDIKECVAADGIGCGRIQPKYGQKGLSIRRDELLAQGAGDTRRNLKAEEAKAILSKISDDDLRLMGLDPRESRPEWMIISVLAVAPPPVRPSVQAGDGARSEDDLTYAYHEIVRTNKELAAYMEGG